MGRGGRRSKGRYNTAAGHQAVVKESGVRSLEITLRLQVAMMDKNKIVANHLLIICSNTLIR